MKQAEFLRALSEIPVYDAHTHLVGDALCAKDFWQIVHYFWFLREMQGAGYPEEPEAAPEEERIERFLYAYQKTRSTGMHYAVSRIFRDLYGIELIDRGSVLEAMRRVKESAGKASWAQEVAQKGHILHTVINREEHKDFIGLDTCVWAPRIDDPIHRGAWRIWDAQDKVKEAAAQREVIRRLLEGYVGLGVTAIMTTVQYFSKKTFRNTGESFSSMDDCLIYMLHAVCSMAQEMRLTVQFFLGMENGYCSVAGPVNRTDRIINLYGLFEQYRGCRFDLVVAAEANNMDVVQAAQIFPNVYVGGMWWFNFRPSTYMDAMAKRFEALASTKSYLSISDSRCIEWCYGKNALIRKLLADFLKGKTEEGYVDYEGALDIARDWLYETPKMLYSR